MGTKKLNEPSLLKALKGTRGISDALSSLQNIKESDIKTKVQPILRGILKMSDDEMDDYIKSLMKEK